jgi:hypothetical protein
MLLEASIRAEFLSSDCWLWLGANWRITDETNLQVQGRAGQQTSPLNNSRTREHALENGQDSKQTPARDGELPAELGERQIHKMVEVGRVS